MASPSLRSVSALTGAAGEYFVAGELCRRGWAAAITPRGVRRTDVLAQLLADPTSPRSIAVQVKTSNMPSRWQLSQKDEEMTDADNEWYALVRLGSADGLPEYFLLPRNLVAALIFLGHREWLGLKGTRGTRKDSSMRNLHAIDAAPYRARWRSLENSADADQWPVSASIQRIARDFSLGTPSAVVRGATLAATPRSFRPDVIERLAQA